MQRDKKYLESAAHAYVAASEKAAEFESEDNLRAKTTARFGLQRRALEYAADFLEHWTRNVLDGGEMHEVCIPAINQLRQLVADADMVIKTRKEQ